MESHISRKTSEIWGSQGPRSGQIQMGCGSQSAAFLSRVFASRQCDLRRARLTSAGRPGAAFTLVEPFRSPKPHDSRTQR